MNEKMKKDFEIVIVLLFFAFIFTAYGPYSGMLASLGIGNNIADTSVQQPPPSSINARPPSDQTQKDSTTTEDLFASLGIGASKIAEQSLSPSIKKELGLLKKLGLEEKTLEGKVMTAIIDTRNSAAGEITETHFFDTLNKTFYRVDDSFKDLDIKRGKKLKIKARVKGNTIKNADILQEQTSSSMSAGIAGGSEGSVAQEYFNACPVITFPGWPGVGPWLVAGAQTSGDGSTNISSVPITISPSTPILDENSTLTSTGGSPFTRSGKVLVVVADFIDQKVLPSNSTIRNWYFSQANPESPNQSVASFYQNASRGKIDLASGDLVRVQIPYKWNGGGLECGATETSPYLYWGSNALFEAKRIGYDEANYDFVSFVFPGGSCADLWGIGYIYSEYTFIFLPSAEWPAHEIGHNLGLQHAMTDVQQYGDRTDIMGMGTDNLPNFVFFNSVHTVDFNWYPLHTVTKNVGTYRIVPISTDNTSEPKIIRVPEVFPWLVSYRVYDGLDLNLDMPQGVYLHKWNPDGNCGILVKQGGSGSALIGWFHGRPITVEVLQADSSAAYVRITSVPYGGEPWVKITDPPVSPIKESLPRSDFTVAVEAADGVAGDASDGNVGNVVSVDVYLDRADTTGIKVASFNAVDNRFSADTYFTDMWPYGDLRAASLGQHNLIAKVTDNDGKTSLSDPVPILVTNTPTDNSPPTVTLVTDPPSGVTIDETSIHVQVEVTDNVAVEKFDVRLDKRWWPYPLDPVSFSCDDFGGLRRTPPFVMECYASFNGFPAGSHTIDVTAKDTTGNIATSTATFNYVPNPDTEPPQLTITKPLNGAIVQPNTVVPITFTLSDNRGAWASVIIDGSSVGCSNYSTAGLLKSFTCNWTVPNLPGTTHYISVRANDGVNSHEVRKQVAVGIGVVPTIDSSPPAVFFSSPLAGSTVTGTAVPVKVTTIDMSNIFQVRITDYRGEIANGWFLRPPYETTFNANAVTLRPGPYILHATAEDIAGNIGTGDVEINIKDIRPPGVNLGLSRPPAINYRRGTINVIESGSDDDKISKIEIYLDGTLVFSSTTLSCLPFMGCFTATWSWNTDLAAQGTHQLYAKAYDPTGNVGTSLTYTVFVDRTAPTTTLSVAPISSGTVSGNVTLTAVPSDAVGVIKNVLFYQDSAYVGTASAAPYTAVVDTTKLSNGSHTFKARAYDMTNNYSAFTTVTVTVANGDATPPTVTLTAPVNGAFVGSNGATLSATASDTNGIAKVEFLVDGAIISTDTTLPYSVLWSTASVAAGTTHTVQARAYDTSNNMSTSALVTVTIEKTPPVVSLTSPVASATLAGTVSLSATASDASGISKVEFYANGVRKGSSVAAASPYTFSWNTVLVPNGTYSLTAKAYDKAGNTAISSAVSVYVRNPDTTAPAVSIISPANGALVTNSTTVNIYASASDFNGIKFVDFYVDGNLKYEDTVSPYVFPWAVPAGAGVTYSLQALAIDNSRMVGSSALVSVTSR